MVRGKLHITANKSSNGKRGPTGGKTAASSSPATHVSTKPASKTKHLSAASCCNCGVVISEDTKALQCERCIGSETWKCPECMNISSELYDQLVSDSSNDASGDNMTTTAKHDEQLSITCLSVRPSVTL